AEPMARMEGEQGLLGLMRALRARVPATTGIGIGSSGDADAFSGGEDATTGGGWGRLEACGVVLGALAAVVSRTRVLDDAMVGLLTELMDRIVVGYPGIAGLSTLQRRLNGEVVGALAEMAAHWPSRLPALLQRLVAVLMTHTLRDTVPLPAGSVTGGGYGEGSGTTSTSVAPWEVYLDLWRALLLLPSSSSGGRSGALLPLQLQADLEEKYGLTVKRRLRVAVYDAMMLAVLDAIRNLNLCYSLPEPEAAVAAATGRGAAATAPATAETFASSGIGHHDVYGAILADSPIDMMSYFHLKCFLQDLLLECGPGLFVGWALPLAEALAVVVSKRPLVSASYSLAAVAIELADKGGLLTPPVVMAGTAPLRPVAVAAAGAAADIFRGLLLRVAATCSQYKDELLVACLKLLLAAPPHMLLYSLGPTTTATSTARDGALDSAAAGLAVPLALALPLGLSYLPVAEAAVAALERWEVQQPEALQAAMPYFVPLLEPYLGQQSMLEPDDAGDGGVGVGGGGGYSGRSAVGASMSRIRSLKVAADAAVPEVSVQLQALQSRLQLWVGRNPAAIPFLAAVDLTALLAAGPPNGSTAAAVGPAVTRLFQHLPWDEDSTRVALEVAVQPAAEAAAHLRLYLDPLLPHAARLAEESPDPQSRTAAAELIHAAALWVVGANAALPEKLQEGGGASGGGGGGGGRRETRFHGLLRRLFPTVLRLAVGPEPLARDLFRQLAFQLVHWYTRGSRREGAEAMALLEAVLAGLAAGGAAAVATSRGDVATWANGSGGGGGGGGLRDLCASLCAEWLEWSEKQNLTTDGDGDAVSVNATSLLRRLMDRLVQPSPDVRQGAAVALAALARPLSRPDNLHLANGYFLEALWLCIRALRHQLADDSGSSGALATLGSDSGSSSGSLGYGRSLVRAITALVHHCLTRELAQQLCRSVSSYSGGDVYVAGFNDNDDDDGGSEGEEGDGDGGTLASVRQRSWVSTLPTLVLWLWRGTGGLAAATGSAAARRESMRLHARLAGAVLEVRRVRHLSGDDLSGMDRRVNDVMDLEDEVMDAAARVPPTPPMGFSGRWLEWRCVRRGYNKLDVLAPFVLTVTAPPVDGSVGGDGGAQMDTTELVQGYPVDSNNIVGGRGPAGRV
ncbi:hypothetical protein VaNZ11_015597, partial [Volvox africanus]